MKRSQKIAQAAAAGTCGGRCPEAQALRQELAQTREAAVRALAQRAEGQEALLRRLDEAKTAAIQDRDQALKERDDAQAMVRRLRAHVRALEEQIDFERQLRRGLVA